MAEHADVPRELNKTSFPTYRVEPPDLLLIQAIDNIRLADSPLEAGDTITVRLRQTLPLETEADPDTNLQEYQMEMQRELANKVINGDYLVQADGNIDLGPAAGKVHVEGLTQDQAQQALVAHFQQEQIGIKDPVVTVALPNVAGKQPVVGEHLVRPDGTISLGIYGQVYVAAMTLPQVKAAVEQHLSTFMHKPEVSVDVLAYNSKVFYLIMDGGGFGEQVIRLPCTGNETVLDAVSQVYGLAQVSSKKIWISRPAPSEYDCAQILDVHWREITREGITSTNYQLFPGDRIYVQADCLIMTDNWIGKIIAPLERIAGFTALGTGTVRGLEFFYRNGQ
ncbi:MAG: polysaccharide biosynthesis/export family protein [Planctomycetaceae bacterium]